MRRGNHGEVIFLLDKKHIPIQNKKGFNSFVEHLFAGDRNAAQDIATVLLTEDQMKELNWQEALDFFLKQRDQKTAEEVAWRAFAHLSLTQEKSEQIAQKALQAAQKASESAQKANESAQKSQ